MELKSLDLANQGEIATLYTLDLHSDHWLCCIGREHVTASKVPLRRDKPIGIAMAIVLIKRSFLSHSFITLYNFYSIWLSRFPSSLHYEQRCHIDGLLVQRTFSAP